MKKITIILLALLLLFSFTSCKKDKTDEVIANYEEFAKAFNLGKEILNAKNTVGEISLDDYTGSNIEDIELIAQRIFGYEDVTITKLTEAKGTVENTQGYTDGEHLTFKDWKFSYECTNDGTVGTGKITISGTASCDEKDGTDIYVYDFVVNNQNYKAEFSTKDNFFTAATVNGKAVEIRLLNGSVKLNRYL